MLSILIKMWMVFIPVNVGKMVQGLPTFIPATPYGIMLLLEHYKIETKGKHAVVIGRSNIVGRPMSILLSSNTNPGNCTVTICHSHTKNLKEICLQADIIVAALGKPGFVTADMVKEGAIVIDVGITRVADATKKSGFKLKGDVDFETVAPKCILDNTGSRWRGPNDHRRIDEKYLSCPVRMKN